MTEQVAIRLTRPEDFGAFCAVLREENVPFSLVGFQTIVLSELTLKRLPGRAPALLEELRNRGAIEITHGLPDSRDRKRPAPRSEAQTEEMLRRLTNNAAG